MPAGEHHYSDTMVSFDSAATPTMAGTTKNLKSFGHHKAWPMWGKWWAHHKVAPAPGGEEPPAMEPPAPEGICDAADNIVEIAVSNPDFSTLVAAVQAAGFVDALSSPGPLVVFAPTNQAFADLLAQLGITAEELLADTELLAQVLSYHVVADGASCDTPLNGVVNTLQGATLDVSGSTVTDIAGNVYNIVATVPASNGQIFVIDGVLLPLSPASPSSE